MAKQGMKHPEPERKKNELPPVPENELAVENMMNDLDMTAADLQDFWRKW